MQIGYARVSTNVQDLINQREQRAAAGCSRIFAERITGTRRDRPELARLFDHLRPDDVVAVTSLYRLVCSTRGSAGDRRAATGGQAGALKDAVVLLGVHHLMLYRSLERSEQ